MSVSSALRELGLRRTGLQHMDEFHRQIDAENNDRGAAILAATFLEGALEYAINRRTTKATANLTNLFDNNGPPDHFAAKLLIADKLGILGPIARKNLEAIKHIRNTFAHTAIHINFSTKEIADACKVLVLPPGARTLRHSIPFSTPRYKYISTCEIAAVALIDYGSRCLRYRSDGLKPSSMVPVMPAPLP
jgi:hypothetical protein